MESQQTMNLNAWTLCDLEVQQLRDMFPDCPADVLKEASEQSVTIDAAIDFIISNPAQATYVTPNGCNDAPNCLNDAASLQDILKRFKPAPVAPSRLTVSRETIFSDCIAFFKQRRFDFTKPLKVTFEGEPAIDGGGPKREFFTVALRSLLSPSATPRLFEGRNDRFLPMHNTDALRANLFKVAGRMVASSILQGGPGFPHFPMSVYSYFQNPTPDDLTEYLSQDDVVDFDHVMALSKIDSICKEDDVKGVAGDVQQLLVETGFPHALSLENRFQAMTSLCLHGIILSRKAELDQFVCGMGPLVDIIKKHPKEIEPLFLAGTKKPLSAEEFLSLVEYEDVNDEVKQHFIRYVELPATRVNSLLMFATGADAVPPMGFCNPS
ncbi:G2/M phase-specific E3 ubiquitin-protein ligase-like [Dendronephthya gigantea]|nr:G2/M phase-specific E3 ubiquitin-protein ligase-like [Dendronephthya gigantea]